MLLPKRKAGAASTSNALISRNVLLFLMILDALARLKWFSLGEKIWYDENLMMGQKQFANVCDLLILHIRCWHRKVNS